MSGTELLKMLSAKGINIEDTGGGGIPELTPQMVSGALGYGELSDHARLYYRIKWCYENNLKKKLWRGVKYEVNDLAEYENWHGGMKIIPLLVHTAMMEALEEKTRCKSCMGTGAEVINSKISECQRCEGTGYKPYSKRHISRMIGIDHRNFSRVWYDRYNRVLTIFYGFEHEVDTAIRTKLG